MKKVLSTILLILVLINIWIYVEAMLPLREQAAGVYFVLPSKSHTPEEIIFHIPGFGFTPDSIKQLKDALLNLQEDPRFARSAHVILNPLSGCTYHFYTDSSENGNPEQKFFSSTLPEVKKILHAEKNTPLFITGGSSGGWSALYLYLNHKNIFHGVWSISPDPVDFRSFFHINLEEAENFYTDEQGQERPEEKNRSLTMRDYTSQVELQNAECESDFLAYDRAYGAPLFQRSNGEIIRSSLLRWSKYDLLKILTRGDRRHDHIRIIVGAKDEYWLNESAENFCLELENLHSTSGCEIIPEKGHRNIGFPTKEYPEGLLKKVFLEMIAVATAKQDNVD